MGPSYASVYGEIFLANKFTTLKQLFYNFLFDIYDKPSLYEETRIKKFD